MSLMRYTPFADFETVPTLRVFQDTMNRLFTEPNGRPWVPPVDIKETENDLIFKADVPDMEMKDIDLLLENGTLTLRGERRFEKRSVEPDKGKPENGKKDGAWHRVERSYGTFERVFTLPETVDVEHVKADYKNGTLTITIPKKEIAKPKQIKVEVTN